MYIWLNIMGDMMAIHCHTIFSMSSIVKSLIPVIFIFRKRDAHMQLVHSHKIQICREHTSGAEGKEEMRWFFF
jgi:hypothetical protein